MFRDSVIAAVRTGVAFIVTWLVTAALGIGAEIDTETAAALSVALFGLGVAGYNFLVGFLERKVHPYFGILLGIPKAPQYGQVGTTTPSTEDGSVAPEGGGAATRNDAGNTSLIFTGIVLAVIGLVVQAVTTGILATIGYIALVVGVIALVVGLILLVLGRSRV